MLADLPATPAQVARHLQISPATLARWQAADQAPRAAMLALFWETRWGRSAADVEAVNWAAMAHRRAVTLERENAALRRHIELLERELARGPDQAANAPLWVSGAF